MVIDRNINDDFEDETELPDVNNNSPEILPEIPVPDALLSVDTDQAPGTAQGCEIGSVEDSPEAAHSYEVDNVEDDMDPMEVHELVDSILQVDGENDSESDDEFGLNDPFNVDRNSKRPHLDLISLDCEIDEDVDEESPVTEEEPEENPREADVNTGANKIIKDGREHVVYPSTGPCYIFLKSNRARPSTIRGHVNDLLTIYQVFIRIDCFE